MPEAITKFAINSTLGTPKFKPLDKIILGQKMFVESESKLCILPDKQINSNSSPINFSIEVGKFTPSISGIIKINVSIYGASSQGARFGILIFENGKEYKKYEYTTGGQHELSESFNVKADNEYTISIFNVNPYSGERAYVIFNNASLCGEVRDYNLFMWQDADDN